MNVFYIGGAIGFIAAFMMDNVPLFVISCIALIIGKTIRYNNATPEERERMDKENAERERKAEAERRHRELIDEIRRNRKR